MLIDPNPETAGLFMRAGLESFAPNELRHFIETDQDTIPMLYEWLELDDPFVRPWAKTVVRIWWPHIFNAGMNPIQLLHDIKRDNPPVGAILDTPPGRIWLNATCFNLLNFFRVYAAIEGDGVIVPPPNLPERLKRRALRGAAGVIERVRGRRD